MTRLHLILIGGFLATWLAAYSIFFHRDVRQMLRERGRIRRERAAVRARLNDELASKYLRPPRDQEPTA